MPAWFFQTCIPWAAFLVSGNIENDVVESGQKTCCIYQLSLSYHLVGPPFPPSLPKCVCFHSDSGRRVLQLLRAARWHLLPGAAPAGGRRSRVLQQPARRGGRAQHHRPSTSRDHAPPTPNYRGHEQWGDLHHHHHKVRPTPTPQLAWCVCVLGWGVLFIWVTRGSLLPEHLLPKPDVPELIGQQKLSGPTLGQCMLSSEKVGARCAPRARGPTPVLARLGRTR